MYKKITFFGFLILLGVATFFFIQQKENDQIKERVSSLRASIEAKIDEGKTPSLTVAVAIEGEIVWAEGFGFSDIESQKQATPETVYAIGSVSKSFVGTLAVILAEKGKLNLDQPVDEIFDEQILEYLSVNNAYPTVRQLIYMTSGVPHGVGLVGFPFFPVSRENLLETIAVTAYPPGSVFHYSNYSIGLAQHAMEIVTGQSFEDLMQEYIFDPLGMDHTYIRYHEDIEKLATPYTASMRPSDLSSSYPEGGLGFLSTVEDLMKYALFHAGEQEPKTPILSREGLVNTHTSYPENVPGALFTLGWFSSAVNAPWGGQPDTGKPDLISNGSVGGGNAHIAIYGDERVIVIVANNMTSREGIVDATAREIAAAFVPGVIANYEKVIDFYGEEYSRPFTGGTEWEGSWEGVLEANGYSSSASLSVDGEGNMAIQFGDDEAIVPVSIVYPQGFIEADLGNIDFGDSRHDGGGNAQMTLMLIDGEIYGHVMLNILEDDMFGSYTYRLRLSHVS